MYRGATPSQKAKPDGTAVEAISNQASNAVRVSQDSCHVPYLHRGSLSRSGLGLNHISSLRPSCTTLDPHLASEHVHTETRRPPRPRVKTLGKRVNCSY